MECPQLHNPTQTNFKIIIIGEAANFPELQFPYPWLKAIRIQMPPRCPHRETRYFLLETSFPNLYLVSSVRNQMCSHVLGGHKFHLFP